MSIAVCDEPAELPPYPVHRWTVEEYLRLGKLGFLGEDDQLELLEGWPVKKAMKNPLHDGTVDQINLYLASRLPGNWYVRVQNVIATADSAPEPDLAVVRGQPKDYRAHHPGPQDVTLVIEVSDTSLSKDRQKRHLYARAGIPTYWIVNLVDQCLEVFTNPTGRGANADYAQHDVLSKRQKVALKVPSRRDSKLVVSELFV